MKYWNSLEDKKDLVYLKDIFSKILDIIKGSKIVPLFDELIPPDVRISSKMEVISSKLVQTPSNVKKL